METPTITYSSSLYTFNLGNEAIEELLCNPAVQIELLGLCNKEVSPKINFLGNSKIEPSARVQVLLGIVLILFFVVTGPVSATGVGGKAVSASAASASSDLAAALSAALTAGLAAAAAAAEAAAEAAA